MAQLEAGQDLVALDPAARSLLDIVHQLLEATPTALSFKVPAKKDMATQQRASSD